MRLMISDPTATDAVTVVATPHRKVSDEGEGCPPAVSISDKVGGVGVFIGAWTGALPLYPVSVLARSLAC